MRANTRSSVLASFRGLDRSLRLTLCSVAVLVAFSGAAKAADDDDEPDNQSFGQKIIGNIMRGIGGTTIDNSNIEYRERSPLVIPPKVELRAPEQQRPNTSPNWPKDPDVAERQARREAQKKRGGTTRDATLESVEASRILAPSELAGQPVSRSSSRDSVIPGATNANPILSPSELGYKGGLFGMFSSKKDLEAEKFKGEPTRESLTQPPVGYQTPSPNFAYGTGGPPGAFTPNYQPPPNPIDGRPR
ncbi:MAG: hypothetical protein A4S14_18205 [Proteobacteria bacterium SG_bin9]|nr:MAG: hypothetical protein A4S14_18205 [Proteobacteria bacterium SG_bin9]